LSSRRRRPPAVFLDESIDAESAAKALRDAGATVERARQHFAPGTPDEEWLAAVGKRGWIVFTRDKRIRYRALELESLIDARVRAFVFIGGNVTSADTAAALAKAFPKVAKIAASERPPFVYNIGRSGNLTKVR
jgi:hypothetical protein